jgi:hypothetical protein
MGWGRDHPPSFVCVVTASLSHTTPPRSHCVLSRFEWKTSALFCFLCRGRIH